VGSFQVLDLTVFVNGIGHLVVDEQMSGTGAFHPCVEDGLVLVGEKSLKHG